MERRGEPDLSRIVAIGVDTVAAISSAPTPDEEHEPAPGARFRPLRRATRSTSQPARWPSRGRARGAARGLARGASARRRRTARAGGGREGPRRLLRCLEATPPPSARAARGEDAQARGESREDRAPRSPRANTRGTGVGRERGSIPRAETAAPRTSVPAGDASGGSAGSGEDSLIRRLRDLPVHAPSSASRAQPSRVARAALVRAWDGAPCRARQRPARRGWEKRAPARGQGPVPRYARLFASAGGAGRPVVLASVVGLDLFWAFAAAIALHR